jgi:hypothetical protein
MAVPVESSSPDPIAKSIGARLKAGGTSQVVKSEASNNVNPFALKLKGGQPKIVEEIPQPSKTIQEGKKTKAVNNTSPTVDDPIFESIEKRVKEGSPT